MVTEAAIALTVLLVVFLVVFLGGATLARLLGSTRVQASGGGCGFRFRFRKLAYRELFQQSVVWLGGCVLSLASPATLERLGDESRLCHDLFLRRSIDSKTWIGGRWLLFMALAGTLVALLSMGQGGWRALVHALAGIFLFGLLLAISLPRLLLAELRALLERYRKRLLVRLPGIVDLWAIGLESGQSVGAAFVQAASQLTDPLTKPVQLRVIRDMQSGMSLSESLNRLGRGLSIKPISQLGIMVSLSVAQGTPLAEPMKNFALQLRQDLYLAAENHAMKAPLRLLVPLVLLIFPSTFIVLLFSVLFRVQQEFAR
jgi:Flp pilus assembly protein TadB